MESTSLEPMIRQQAEELLREMALEFGREPTEEDRKWADLLALGLITGDFRHEELMELYADET
jgi:hypothetical protein